ncbi:sulfotransferase [bacterium]|nr:sulfotransferase [bacterium]
MQNISSEGQTPIFLCGHRKTGTTLLLSLFDNHPNLVTFPPDSGFFYAWYPKYASDEFTREQKIQRIIDTMYYNLKQDLKKLEAYQGGFEFEALNEHFRSRMEGKPADPGRLIEEAILAYGDIVIENDPSEIKGWVEKTTSTEIYAGELFNWFPNAKVIHLLRDPRDNYSSLKSGWQARYSKQADSIERIRQSMIDRGLLGMKMAAVNQEIYGAEQYKVVRFEDLTTKPMEVLQEICEFTGVDRTESMLFPSYMGLPWKGNNFDGLKFEAISPVNVGRWRQRIEPEEAHLIEFHFEPEMHRWGYELSSTADQRSSAAREHYKWHNFAQEYSVHKKANTYSKATT